MNANHQLLQFIHKNAAMGVGTIPQAMSLPQSRAMKETLHHQLEEYQAIATQSQLLAKVHGQRVRRPGPTAFAMSDVMLRAQTALDPSTTRLAELMIRGSTMGTVQMTRRLHQYMGQADGELLALGSRLLRTEEENIQEMKRFL